MNARQIKKKSWFAHSGIRTRADRSPVDLESTAFTTRPYVLAHSGIRSGSWIHRLNHSAICAVTTIATDVSYIPQLGGRRIFYESSSSGPPSKRVVGQTGDFVGTLKPPLTAWISRIWLSGVGFAPTKPPGGRFFVFWVVWVLLFPVFYSRYIATDVPYIPQLDVAECSTKIRAIVIFW